MRNREKVNFLIVGQGLAGSWLAYQLVKQEFTIKIFNNEKKNTSSLSAAGMYNPITGRNMVKTWLADELFENLEKDYQTIEDWGKSRIIYPTPMLRLFSDYASKNDIETKITEKNYEPYIDRIVGNDLYHTHLTNDHGGFIIKNTGYVNVSAFIFSMRNFFIQKQTYIPEYFDTEKLKLTTNDVSYEHFTADKVIFCEGVNTENKFWHNLPFSLVRGELMDIRCNFESNHIINKGIFMIPKKEKFTIGSTYDKSILSYTPQKKSIYQMLDRFKKIYPGFFEVISIRAGIRPATIDRKPLIGFHPQYPRVGVFNGMGSKGISLSSYFAKIFASHISQNTPLPKTVDVQRFY